MDYNTAKTLLDRYFTGTSSLEEEAQLRTYFQQDDVPAELEPYRPLFQFFTQAGQQQTSTDFTERLESLRDIKQNREVRKLRPLWYRIAVAALVVLALAAWMLMSTAPPENKQTAAIDWSQYEPKDEEEAIRITTAALQKTSSSLRRGIQAASNELEGVKKIVQPW